MSYTVSKANLTTSKAAIIEFWNSHNDKKLDQKFSWIYEGNPDGIADTWLITHRENDVIVGMISVFPRTFAEGSKRYRGGIQGDFFIHPNHRSLGPALMLIRAITNYLDNSDYDFLYGFPNQNAVPVLKRTGYSRLGQSIKYTRLYNIERLLCDRLGVRKTSMKFPAIFGNFFLNALYRDTWQFNTWNYTSRISKIPDYQTDKIVEAYSSTEATTFKTSAYLKWKYSNDPDDEHLFFNVYDQERNLIGSIVYRFDMETIEIRDAVYPDRLTAVDLFSMFFKKMKRAGKEYVYLYTLCNAGFKTIIDELQMTPATVGRNIYYKIAKKSDTTDEIAQFLNSSNMMLLRTDQDT